MNVSTITIQNIRLNTNGDNYTCRAENDVGYDKQTTIIYVFGKELVMTMNGLCCYTAIMHMYYVTNGSVMPFLPIIMHLPKHHLQI